MNALIIDDNPSIRNLLQKMIVEHCPDVKILGFATNVEEGVNLIRNNNPQLIFLDVEMPDGDGFSLLKQVSNFDFQVIFITAHEKYALRAIKFSALDYLLKPIDVDGLMTAVEKAKSELDQQNIPRKFEVLMQNLKHQQAIPQKIVLRDKYGIQIVNTNNIIRLEANGSYTKFVIDGSNPILISKGLKEYNDLLSSNQFFRCHQSHIINMEFLHRYDKREGDFLYLSDGSKVPLAVRKRETFLDMINTK